MEISDRLMTVTTVLFILSMVSERVVTFIKLWCVKGKVFLFFIVPEEVNTCEKSDDPQEETKRTRSILAINITIGFFIALLSKASLFDLFTFSDDTGVWASLFSWQAEEFKNRDAWQVVARLMSIVFGCFLTGSFISLGSKFWHDLLDLLFQTKNLKEKLIDQQSYQANSVQQLEEYIDIPYFELARIALDQNKATLDKMEGVENYFVSVSANPLNRKPVIIINSSLAAGGNYPDFLQAELPKGKRYKTPVEIIYGYDVPGIQLSSGDSISNTVSANFTGTICCTVEKDSKKYLLTCGHILTGGAYKVDVSTNKGWIQNPVQDDTESEDEGFRAIGTWAFGLINSELDIALVETDMDVQSPVSIKGYPPAYDYKFNHKEVFVVGDKNRKKGYVAGYAEKELVFKYNGSNEKVSKLILISANKSNDPKTITEGGDSGALVYFTDDKTPLGMVLGGNSQYTYVMPLQSILLATKTKLT